MFIKGKMWHQQFERKPEFMRTSPDGIKHHSVEEMERWCKLQMDEKLGLIRGLRRQVRFPLEIEGHGAVRTPSGRVAVYTSDFVYSKPGRDENGLPIWVEVIEDHKGFTDKLAEFRIAVFEMIYQKKVYIHKR